MINRLETLPNEVLLSIFSCLSWFEMITSLWSLNKRFNSLICSILSTNGINLTEPGLSFKKCCSTLFPLICNSSSPSLASYIHRIHFDGTNSSASDFIYEWLFYNNNNHDGNIHRYPNLKSVVLTRCLLVESLNKTLKLFMKHRLDELTLTFDKEAFEFERYLNVPQILVLIKEKQVAMLKQLLHELFSSQCQLTSLRLDIADGDFFIGIYQCLPLPYNLASSSIRNEFQSSCLTMRRLHIRLSYTCFMHYLIDHVPALEQLSIHFEHSLTLNPRSKLTIEDIIQAKSKWFDMVPKLQYFILRTFIDNDLEFVYLKWILNNLNHIQKLKLRLGNTDTNRTDAVIWNSVVDANFIRQYCMPDIATNLIDFDFYISSKCQQLSVNSVETIINSFKIHPFFIDRQWTNVTCFFDPIISDQHLSSSMVDPPKVFDGLM
ncbi:unnamed protein product [Rotaria sp. Silwood1]|nr:unnamed protein product [Rotaria sp. Silwood1]